AAAPVGGAAFERDVLLATKLHMPRAQPGFVARVRLGGGPGGGGGRGGGVGGGPGGVWERGRVWRGGPGGGGGGGGVVGGVGGAGVGALDGAGRGVGGRAGPALGPPAPPSLEGVVTAVINELAAVPGEDKVVLVLDDYHLIDAGPVHDSLVFLLEHLPPG